MEHWHEAAKAVRPHVVRIETPTMSGTGFFIATSATGGLVGIATAAHVVNHCHNWEQPMRITHASSGKSVFLHEKDRAIFANWERDTAAVVFARGELGLPNTELPLIDPEKMIKVGVEIGWLGYPGVVREGPCFFSGRTSLYRESREDYLVDGVAIQGVSGAPAFDITQENARLVGVLSAYIPNRLTGETLPGLAVVTDVSSLKSQIEQIRSFGAAKSSEAQLTQEGSSEGAPHAAPPEKKPTRRKKK